MSGRRQKGGVHSREIAFVDLVRRLVNDAKRNVTHGYFASGEECVASMTCVRTFNPAIKHMIETYSGRVRMADSVDPLFFEHGRSKGGSTYENKYAMTGPVDLDMKNYPLYMTILSNSTGRVYSLFIYDHDHDDRVLRSVHGMCTEFARRTADEYETEWLDALEYRRFPRLVGDRNDSEPDAVSKAGTKGKVQCGGHDDGETGKMKAQVLDKNKATLDNRRCVKKTVTFSDNLHTG